VLFRSLEFNSIIDQFLTEGWGVMNGFPVQSFDALMTDVLEALVQNLEKRAQLYTKQKQPTLGVIFLLNNFNYMYKILAKEKNLGQSFGNVEERFEKLVSKQKDAYLNSWKSVYDHLMDATYIQSGVMVKTLSKAQREVVKDKFKGFNSDIEEMSKAQKLWAIPDQDLKHSLLKDVKNVLFVLYTRFYDRYQTIEFSKTPTKYCKYDKDQLEEILNSFFTS